MSQNLPLNDRSSIDSELAEKAYEYQVIRRHWIRTAFATVQSVFFLLLTIWILSQQSIFLFLFSSLCPEHFFADVQRLIVWMHSSQDITELFSLVQEEGRLNAQELAHYQDVRVLLRWLPLCVFISFFFWALFSLTVPQYLHISYASAQKTFLRFWFGLFFILAVWGAFHWDSLFSVLHFPFFGPDSWRLPEHSYSLQLFPEWFWGIMGMLTIFLPFLFSLILLKISRRQK